MNELSDRELAEQMYNSYYDHLIELKHKFTPYLECQGYIQKRWIKYAKDVRSLITGD